LMYLFILFGLPLLTVLGPFAPALITFMPIIIAVAVTVSAFAITVRRLHDIGLSGWWYPFMIVLTLSIPVIAIMLHAYLAGADIADINFKELDEDVMGSLIMESPFALGIPFAVAQLITLFFNLMLLLWPGTKGPNKYGGYRHRYQGAVGPKSKLDQVMARRAAS